MKQIKKLTIACIPFFAAALIGPLHLSGGPVITTITAKSATGGLSSTGTNTWSPWNVTNKTSISWSSGTNVADRTTFCATPCPMGSEPKFDFTPPVINPPGFGGRNAFGGFTRSDVGPLGSTADTSGTGSSRIVPCWGGVVVCGEANWKVDATGSLAPTVGINWVSVSEGKDPWAIDAADFFQFTDPLVDLYIPLELTSTVVAPEGSAGLSVSYETAAGILSLLNLRITALGVTVTGSALRTVSYYAISGVLTGPNQLGPATPLSSIFQPGMNLQNPAAFGIVVHGLTKPVGSLADGSAAHVNIDTIAQAQAEVPEPTTIAMVGAALLILGKLRRNRF